LAEAFFAINALKQNLYAAGRVSRTVKKFRAGRPKLTVSKPYNREMRFDNNRKKTYFSITVLKEEQGDNR